MARGLHCPPNAILSLRRTRVGFVLRVETVLLITTTDSRTWRPPRLTGKHAGKHWSRNTTPCGRRQSSRACSTGSPTSCSLFPSAIRQSKQAFAQQVQLCVKKKKSKKPHLLEPACLLISYRGRQKRQSTTT